MRSRGYTLIEIMVVVAIVGIVSAIAYPQYQGYLSDTWRTQAVADLKACSMALERYYSNGFTYTGADTNTICNSNSPTKGEVRYTISYESLTATTFTVRASPVGEACGVGNCFEIDQSGDQTHN